ncbi:M24 family metallopeptidase [Neobacillus terrae]|uniref:M24 family metallopeptidase n=1 Tax=Neobacillus terrae TaxID=3034837 RepID=UPI00140CAD22|nr:Xaa-Pro peptidase family protein [Neobacillus terrae]NHM31295.1 aminopeptidase P family protein [Neobacillus terrae]
MSVAQRLERLRSFMDNNQLSAVVITSPDNQFYFSGFKALIYSRPIYYVVTQRETALIVPGLEETHALADSNVDHVSVYYEHPEKEDAGKDSTLALLKYLESINGSNKRVGLEYSTSPIMLEKALQGANWEILDTTTQIVKQRAVKDQEEISIMKEAGRLVSLALSESFTAIREGITEIELDSVGNAALFKEVSRIHPNATLDIIVMSPSGVERSVMPHVFSNTRKLQKGDVVIHSRQVAFNGYRAECERTFIVGEPTAEQQRAFEVAVEAQLAALNAIKAGVLMKDVDLAARKIIQQAGYGEYAIHRTGHSIGVSAHEGPFLRFDANEPLAAGMAFSIEPGFYVPGLGGFRHSDTIIVTEDGYELITEYPSEVKALIYN